MPLQFLQQFTDLSILILRILLALVFVASGINNLNDTQNRAKVIGMSPTFTFFLGLSELIGGLSVGLGIFTHLGSLVLIGIMLGAIYKKIFEWKTGFWGEKAMGWYYDLLYLAVSFLVLFTGGGRFTIV